MSAFFNIKLDTACMKVCHVVFWSRAAFDKVQVRPLVNDNQGVLELAGPLCIQAEVRLKRNLDLYALGNINE